MSSHTQSIAPFYCHREGVGNFDPVPPCHTNAQYIWPHLIWHPGYPSGWAQCSSKCHSYPVTTEGSANIKLLCPLTVAIVVFAVILKQLTPTLFSFSLLYHHILDLLNLWQRQHGCITGWTSLEIQWFHLPLNESVKAVLYFSALPDESICWCVAFCAVGVKVQHCAYYTTTAQLKSRDILLKM